MSAFVRAPLSAPLAACFIALAIVASPCLFPAPATAQSQAAMNDQAGTDWKKADTEMNRVYKQLIAALTDPKSVSELKAAQRAWIVFRDAHATYMAGAVRGGSMYGMIYGLSLADTTRTRTAELKRLLKRAKTEGDL